MVELQPITCSQFWVRKWLLSCQFAAGSHFWVERFNIYEAILNFNIFDILRLVSGV